jgi:hypothetical protein
LFVLTLAICSCSAWPITQRPIDADRLSDVLEPLVAQELKPDLDLVLELIEGRTRDNYSARVCHGLQASRDIDAVSVPILAFNDYISKIDSHTDFDPLIVGNTPVPVG